MRFVLQSPTSGLYRTRDGDRTADVAVAQTFFVTLDHHGFVVRPDPPACGPNQWRLVAVPGHTPPVPAALANAVGETDRAGRPKWGR